LPIATNKTVHKGNAQLMSQAQPVFLHACVDMEKPSGKIHHFLFTLWQNQQKQLAAEL